MFRQLHKQNLKSIQPGREWEFLICPLHNGAAKHWSLLLIQRDTEQVYHYDSLSFESTVSLVESRVSNFTDKKTIKVMSFPSQNNSFDAGVYML